MNPAVVVAVVLGVVAWFAKRDETAAEGSAADRAKAEAKAQAEAARARKEAEEAKASAERAAKETEKARTEAEQAKADAEKAKAEAAKAGRIKPFPILYAKPTIAKAKASPGPTGMGGS